MRFRRLTTFVLSAVVVFAAARAWAGNAAAALPNSSNSAISHIDLTDNGNKVGVFFSTSKQKEAAAAQKALSGAAVGFACTAGNLLYNGGPVMRNPTNYVIFWQPPGRAAFPAGYQAAVEKFFQDLSGTPLYNIVTQYNDTSAVPVPDSESLGATSFTDTTTVPPSGCSGDPSGTIGSPPDCPLTDGDIQNEVDVALAANPTWAKPGTNVEYFVYTPSDVGECDGSKNMAGQFNCFASNIPLGPNQAGSYCAYHGDHSGGPYAFQPFTGNGNCFPSAPGFPNGPNVDTVLGATSHEMIESNTDPDINAWIDSCGAEIGDKCAYNLGFTSPDGTNIVLTGDRYQIQQEWSNDVSGCAKRFGDPPGTSVPSSIDFGEVEAGNTAEHDVVIQNTGGGDLNILNIRLDSSSDPSYSLLNVPPTSATLHAGDSLTVKVQFAPPSGSSFGHLSATLDVDTDYPPGSPTYNTSITGTVGVQPVANCQNVTVSTDPNLCTNANASINNGSNDPDGETITLTQTPGGPYTLGSTAVALNVADQFGLTASCIGTVTVQDHQNPTITCPAAQTVQCMNASGAAVSLNPTFSDNCPGVSAACVPASGSTFGFGTTPVTCTATDGSGNTSSCNTSVTVTDVAPVIQSVVASPNVLRPPNKKLDPVTIIVQDSEACGLATTCSISGVTTNSGPAPAGSVVITGPLSLLLRANGNGGHALTYIVAVTCTDSQGGSTTAQTTVQAPL